MTKAQRHTLNFSICSLFKKYWAVQEDINLENRGGNYSRNLEQSSSVYIPAPYSREGNSEPPAAGYYRLARESPSIHSSAAASTSQVGYNSIYLQTLNYILADIFPN